jgi:uncharacterized membrane protein YfcA
MSADRLRVLLIALIAVAAVVGYIGNRNDSRVVSSLGFGVFLVAVLVYPYWRRAMRRERDARVFDREAKTDETSSRTDQ